MNKWLVKINCFAQAIYALAKQSDDENTDTICMFVNEIKSVVSRLKEKEK